ncbi:MFS general substrate transporter [Fomitiporia mediterranea MF3/22]|uniref:MFS general substrate transporter n=1 Tax=Fomitiporia mediterranea (strain MF3/22) TaxID=694068 RepID=UPI000440810A|nr:MFS general substrate transporter [Fomitiporia mediterranea MF3/22]EJD00008.1 MFS general substrate transporter [Fomitiporia mediterranea MF3/22]
MPLSKDVAEWRDSSVNLESYQPGTEAEKRLVRKMDLRIVPAVWLLYTLSYLDRANIGNAKSGGMEEDLNLSSTQYSVILLVFFISYVIFEVPANMILSRVRPSIYLSAICFFWGVVAACMAAGKNWSQIAAVRFCLGIVEAAFAPGVAFYLSSWYKMHELARRYSVYYTATAVSGAFSGLLAGVITDNLNGARGIAGWRWLLLIEGVASSGAGLFAWIILPDWPATTRWLTDEERNLAVQRLLHDGIASSGAEAARPSHTESLKMSFREWRLYPLIFMYMLATGSQTIQYFIPTLVGQLGYKGYTLQFMTIPIYSVALVGILVFCFISDYRRERGHYVTITACIGFVSFIITVAATNKKVQYAFLCFGVGGVYAACPLTLLWVSAVIPHPAEKRAVAIAIVNSLGNSASIYGSFLWPSKDAPRYVPGFSSTTVFLVLLAVSAQIFRYFTIKHPYVSLNARIGRSATATPDTEKAADL